MKQNRNFNFQGVSSTNEKMLIILSWIIVVIIVVLIGLYYGQQVREQAVTAVKVDSKSLNQGEVAADSNSRIEENEMKVAKDSTSVLTDSLALNKNEVFTVQIGSAVDGEYYDENQINEIEKEFSAKNLYTQKVIINPDKKQFILQVGLFKAYEEAKTLLNNVKLKNYPAQIETIIDPKTEIAFIPKTVESKSSNEITVASADSRVIDSLKQPSEAEPGNKADNKNAEIKNTDVKVPDGKISNEPPAADFKPAETDLKKENIEVNNKIEDKPVEPVKQVTDTQKVENSTAVPDKTATVKVVKDTPDVKVVVKTPKNIANAQKEIIGDNNKIETGSEVKPETKPETKTNAKPENKVDKKDKTAPENNDVKISEEEIVADAVDSKPVKSSAKTKKEVKPVTTETKTAVKPADEEAAESDEILADESGDAKLTSKSGKGGYYVQLGTYKSVKNAETLKDKVAKLGFSNVTAVMVKNSSGSSVYRVRLEGYSSKSEAAQEFAKIKENFPDIKSPLISK